MKRYAVFIRGGGNVDDATVAQLAAATELSDIDSRLILKSPIPRRVVEEDAPEDAKRASQALQKGGFNAFAVDLEQAATSRATEVRSAAFADDGVTFKPMGRFAQGELKLLILGSSFSKVEARARSHLRAGLDGRMTTGLGSVRRSESELFLHLYGTPPAPALEIRARSFDFRCLGAALEPTRPQNLKKLVERIREMFPGAEIDDTLTRHPLPPGEEFSGHSFAGSVFGGSIEQSRRRTSTSEVARRVSWLISRAILGNVL